MTRTLLDIIILKKFKSMIQYIIIFRFFKVEKLQYVVNFEKEFLSSRKVHTIFENLRVLNPKEMLETK